MRTRIFNNAILLLVIIQLIFSCHKPEKQTGQSPKWTSTDPSTIPFRVRQQKYLRSNLLINGSFESGRKYTIDTIDFSFTIDGWQKSGDHVDWVDITKDSLYKKNEVFQGNHAIKIHREKANETDIEGEGVISEFIKVIPGNYLLNFHVRLENIESPTLRLGTKLYDAIDIRLKYFDKNRIAISGDQYIPVIDKKINSSIKWLSFANLWAVDKMEWTRVVGKSHDFTISSGDIPDEARYVKVFLGLKGTGTMWIDQAELYYTSVNFSPLEQLESMLDTSFSKYDMLIPTPKHLKKLESIRFFSDTSELSGLPVILVPEYTDNITRLAAEIIRNKILDNYHGIHNSPAKDPVYEIRTRISQEELAKSKLVFSIGKNHLSAKFAAILPYDKIADLEQAYFISTQTDLPNVVFLSGNDPGDNLNAAYTAIQLFDNMEFIFHNARIIDYPDFFSRNVIVRVPCPQSDNTLWGDLIKNLAKVKLNGFYLNMKSSPVNKKSINELGKAGDLINKYSGVGCNAIITWPGFFAMTQSPDNSSFSLTDISDHIKPADIPRIFSAGIDNIAFSSFLFFNPYFVNYSSIREVLPATTSDSFYQIAEAAKNYDGNNKGIELLPVWFNNKVIDLGGGKGELYFNELTDKYDNLSLLWTGNDVFTSNLSILDVKRFEGISNTSPVLLDNTLMISNVNQNVLMERNLYPGKIRSGSLFSPYRNNYFAEAIGMLKGRKVILNYQSDNEFDVIRMITAADYYWNTKDYDPWFALVKVLIGRYGINVAKELLLFDRHYKNIQAMGIEFQHDRNIQRLQRRSVNEFKLINENIDYISGILGKDHKLVLDMIRHRGKLTVNMDQMVN